MMKMKPYILAQNNWKTVSTQEVELAILPWGATEAHNYHLPFGTDIYEVEAIAEASAAIAWGKGGRPVVLPAIPFGVNTGQSDIRMTINMSPSTQAAVLNDIVESLEGQGIHRLLLINGHGGNDFKQMLRETGKNYPGMFLATCNWFQSVDKNVFFVHDGDHADEAETSLMMHLQPGLVLPLDQAGDGSHKKFSVDELNEKWAWSERKWTSVTSDTGIGDPSESSKEKGERFLKAISEKLGGLIYGLCKMDEVFKTQDLF